MKTALSLFFVLSALAFGESTDETGDISPDKRFAIISVEEKAEETTRTFHIVSLPSRKIIRAVIRQADWPVSNTWSPRSTRVESCEELPRAGDLSVYQNRGGRFIKLHFPELTLPFEEKIKGNIDRWIGERIDASWKNDQTLIVKKKGLIRMHDDKNPAGKLIKYEYNFSVFCGKTGKTRLIRVEEESYTITDAHDA